MSAQTPVPAQRKLTSWIDSFIEYSANTGSPKLFRKWAAISTIAATLEQKVWITTSEPLYPNLYTFLIGDPGVGKSRALSIARRLMMELPDPYIAPTSVNSASIVDHMLECRRSFVMNMKPYEYHAMTILVGEFGQLMTKYEDDLIAMLTDFYDVTPYGQRRRGNQLKIKIDRPLLNMMIGSTPSNLMKFMPEGAWDQGFTSRIIFVYSDERIFVDDFAEQSAAEPADLIADLKAINLLGGQFGVTPKYAEAVNQWRKSGENPRPNHPKLLHYLTRRKAHLYRLSMVSAIDRGNSLILTEDDFVTALAWMVEAESAMGHVFKAPNEASDSKAMDEIYHFVHQYNLAGRTLPEQKLVNFARERVPSHAVLKVLDLMINSHMLAFTTEKSGLRQFVAVVPDLSPDAGQSLLQ